MKIQRYAKKRLLLVDDDRVYRTILADEMRRIGYAVTEALSGEDAVRQVREHDCGFFDAVVCDFFMPPGLTGGEAVNLIRRECPDQPVIFLSGADAAPYDLRAHEAFLQKPAMPEHIAAEVERLTSERVTLPPGP